MGGGKRSFSPVTSSSWHPAEISGSQYSANDLNSGASQSDYQPQEGHREQTMSGSPVGGRASEGTVLEQELKCTVGTPIKEGDGSKDAFVSYLITTNVCDWRWVLSAYCCCSNQLRLRFHHSRGNNAM